MDHSDFTDFHYWRVPVVFELENIDTETTTTTNSTTTPTTESKETQLSVSVTNNSFSQQQQEQQQQQQKPQEQGKENDIDVYDDFNFWKVPLPSFSLPEDIEEAQAKKENYQFKYRFHEKEVVIESL